MSRRLALELNDLGLAVAGEPPFAPPEPSPGWAVFEPEGGVLRVATEAAERIRLNPRLAHRNVWGEIALEPLPKPFPRGLSTADLAYAHLRSVWDGVSAAIGRSEPVEMRLLAAPGSFSPEQLGLVLGIAESLGRPFTGVVDSAVAAASTLGPGPALLLDLELGRAVATSVEALGSAGEARLRRRRVLARQGAGWNALLDGWARAVARSFIATTRFDPQHAAATDQDLYRELPGWLAALGGRETIQATMRAGGREHAIVLTRAEIAAAAEPVYVGIVELLETLAGEIDGAPLVVSERVRRAPGLLERLVRAGHESPRALAAGAALDGALRHAERLHRPSDPEPRWATELPAGTPVATEGVE